MAKRSYDLVRSLVESLGGAMTYERKHHRYGAWVVYVRNKTKIIEATGGRSFPELDSLYVPKIKNPKHWDDYYNVLRPDAKARLLVGMGISPVPPIEAGELTQIIEAAKWNFAWTYARTYPHEYTTKKWIDHEDHALLIEYIEVYGVSQPFNQQLYKYLYFGERKYWHMGNPRSEVPEEQPNVINRTWVDVRRHAENVRGSWTAEEVELQMRIWEIQLEKKQAANRGD